MEDTKKVPEFILSNIENTLRLCANHFNSYDKKTCLDRDIVRDLNCIRKILLDREITGLERVEKLITLN